MLGWMGVDNPSTTTPWLKSSSAQCLKIVNLSWNMLNFAKLTGWNNFGQLGDIVGFDPVPSALVD